MTDYVNEKVDNRGIRELAVQIIHDCVVDIRRKRPVKRRKERMVQYRRRLNLWAIMVQKELHWIHSKESSCVMYCTISGLNINVLREKFPYRRVE